MSSLGFRVNKLGDKTLPNSHFGENFEKLTEECPLGIVVLDGFRPNVLFEYGFLRGSGRVILPIQDKKSYIATKSLYSIKDTSNEREVREKTGLTKMQFDLLIEPPIGYFGELSDRHGINVVVVECDAERTSPNHPKHKIISEVNKLMPQILDRYTKRSLEPIAQKSPQYIKRFQEVTLKTLQYYMDIIPFTSSDIDDALKEMRELERESSVTLPSAIYETFNRLYITLAEQALPLNIPEAMNLYRKAIKVNHRILDTETDSLKRADAKFRVGNAYRYLSGVRNKEANITKAIKAYKEALTVHTKKDFPVDYAMTQNNLGSAYHYLSEVRNKKANITKAIKALKEALTVYTKKDFPIRHAQVKQNLELARAYFSKASFK